MTGQEAVRAPPPARLAADGLIVSHRRRWVVYEHTLEEIADIYEVRMALEGVAARLACRRATDEQITALEESFDNRPPEGERAPALFPDFNSGFHGLTTEAADNPCSQHLADRNRFSTFNSQLAQHDDDADVAESNGQHEVILRAIMARDPGAAEHAAREHVAFSLQIIRERLGRQEQKSAAAGIGGQG